ncbi:hypothetical protein V8G54_001026 [Vigna mungo]|uniref:Uncharacterized protein n=1 Tax=Vigna mungo TaxID=3915 RepID=A0AAQ3P7Z0_VIGMU
MLVGSASIDEKDNTEATVANEASAETTLANEASAEATETNEASAEATKTNEASTEATETNEARAEATETNEASAEAKICIELSSEGKRANESSSEAKIVSDVSSEAKVAYEASSALPVGSFEQKTSPCPDTGAKKLHFLDTSRQPLYERISSCVTTASGKMDKPHEPSDNADQECAKEAGVTPVLHESIEMPGDEVSISSTKDDKEAIPEFHDKSSSKVSGIL